MTEDLHATPFTVEIQQSFDPMGQHWQQHIFIKLYTAALASGFLAAISDRDWKTLCVIALHMNAEGQCYPSRDRIAQALGVSPCTASQRIQSLLDFRWQGQPLVRATRDRLPDGTLGRQVYTILPITPMAFGPDRPAAAGVESPPAGAQSTMLRNRNLVPESTDAPGCDLPPWRLPPWETATSTNKIQDRCYRQR